MKRLLACLLLPLFITACGSDSSSTPDPEFPKTLNLGDDYIATLSMSDVKNGIADLTVNIKSTDGRSLEGKDISLSPLMVMNSGMKHGTPFENGTGLLDANGSFTSTAYFLMPSNMASGDPMGNWSINVSFNEKTESIPITVEMMASDVKTLKGGDNDQIMNMGDASGTLDRTYYFYNRGRHVNASMNMFEVYISARETMMDYQAVAEDNVLNADSMMHKLIINSVVAEMCIKDCDNDTNWITAMPKPNYPGIYQGMDLGLTGDETDVVMVRLTVNDEIKDNGAAQDAKTSVMFSFNDSASSTTTHDHM